MTARQSAPDSLWIEVRAQHPLFAPSSNIDLAWTYVEDCLGESLGSAPRESGR